MPVLVDRSTGVKMVGAATVLALSSGFASVPMALAQTAGTTSVVTAAGNHVANSADAVAVAMTKAQALLASDDLRGSERLVRGVLARTDVTPAQTIVCQGLLTKIIERRSTVTPAAPALLAEAGKHLKAGKLVEAKTAVATILNWGVTLPASKQGELEMLQLAILDAQNGGSVRLGMLQEGQTRAKDEPKKDETKKDEPKPAPTSGGGTELQPGVILYPPVAGTPAAAPVMDLPELPRLPGMAPEPFFPGQVAAPAAPIASDPMPVSAPAPAPAFEQAPVVAAAPMPAPVADDLLTLALKAEAQRLIVEADALYDQSRFSLALRNYETVLGSSRQYLSSDEIAHAEKRIAECKVRLNAPSGAGGLESAVVQNFALVREKATAEFNNQIGQGETALGTGDADRALSMASAAQLTIDRNKDYLSQSEYDGMASRVRELRRQAGAKGEEIRISEAKKREEDAKKRSEEVQKNLSSERRRRVDESISRIRALQKEQKYDQALELVDQVLFLDPNNPSGLLLREVIQEVASLKRGQEAIRRNQEGFRNARLDNIEAGKPTPNLVDYPEDWPRLTMLRTGATGAFESPENRRATAMLDAAIPGELKNVQLTKAFDYIRETTKVAFDVDWNSLENIGVSRDTKVSLSLGEKPAKVVLERLLQQVSKDRFAKADYAINDGIIKVGSADVIQQNTIVRQYPIDDLLIFTPDYADLPNVDLANVVGKQPVGVQVAAIDPFRDRAKQLDPRADKRERVRNLVSVITSSVDANNWRENGGTVGSVQEINGVLVIVNTPKNHREIDGILSRLREVRQTQINIETRFLLVNQNFFEQIQLDVDFFFNRGSSLPTALTPATPEGPSTVSPIGFQNNPGRRGQNNAGGGPSDLIQFFAPRNNTFLETFYNQSGPAFSFAGAFLDGIGVDFVLTATQLDSRTVTLTAPRLTLTNGQIANVVVGTQRAFVSDLEVVTGSGAVGFDPVPETISDGVVLLVEAVASADRRYVTVNIETSVSRVEELAPFTQEATAGGTNPGGAPGPATVVEGTFQLPVLAVSRVQTTVTAPDQGTILLGGQRVTTNVEVEVGVPVLSKIPIINRFFTNRMQLAQDQSLMILLKPTILIQAEQEENAFPGLIDSLRSTN